MKIKKQYLIVFGILIFYFLIMCIIFNDKSKNTNPTYILLDSKNIWKYQAKEWKNVTNSSNAEYDWEKFDIYENQEKKGSYKVHFYNNEMYIFDDQKNRIRTEGNVLAIKGNKKINIIPYKESSIENEKIYQILEELNIESNSDLTKLSSNKKITIDIDNDQEKETFYSLSNIFIDNDELISNKKFSVIAMEKNNKISFLMDEIYNKEEFMEYCNPEVFSIIDVNEDEKLEIISKCVYVDQIGTYYNLYNLKKGKYEPIIKRHP